MPYQPAVSEPPRLTYPLPADVPPDAADALDALLSATLEHALALLRHAPAADPAPPEKEACRGTGGNGRRCRRAVYADGYCRQHQPRAATPAAEPEPEPEPDQDPDPEPETGPAPPVARPRNCERCGGLLQRQTTATAAGRDVSLTCLNCGRDAPRRPAAAAAAAAAA